MNARQWRQRGFRTIFRDGRIYLFLPVSGIVVSTSIRSGDWTEYDRVNARPWELEPRGIAGLAPTLAADLKATARACYCDKGVDTCDFCAGIRRTPTEVQP